MGNRRSISGTDKKRAAFGLLIIFLIILGDLISGAIGLAGPVSSTGPIYQEGVVQCNMILPNETNAGDGPGCHGKITFPKPFGSMPTAWGINIDCMANQHQDLSTQNGTKICAQAAASGEIAHSGSNALAFTSSTIIAQNFTVANYPTTLAPLCFVQPGGQNSNCDVGIDLLGVASLGLAFTCVSAPLATGNEWMGVQISDNGGLTWTTETINDTDVGGLCPLIPAFASRSAVVAIVPAVSGNTIRIIGGGGGAGDRITFENIAVDFTSALGNVPSPEIGQPAGGPNIVSKTSAFFYVYALTDTSMNPIMNWWACIC